MTALTLENVLTVPKMTEEASRKRNLEIVWFLQKLVVLLLKLYFFCVIEHILSSEDGQAWEDTNKMVNTFATHEEEVEFLMEFGRAQPGRGKRQVQYDSAEWEPAFLRQAREFLFFPLLPREASK